MSVLLTSKKKRSVATATVLLAVAVSRPPAVVTTRPRHRRSAATSPPPREVQKDDELFAMLPAEVQDAGTISVGTEALYPPYEYLDEDGRPSSAWTRICSTRSPRGSASTTS